MCRPSNKRRSIETQELAELENEGPDDIDEWMNQAEADVPPPQAKAPPKAKPSRSGNIKSEPKDTQEDEGLYNPLLTSIKVRI